MKRIGRIAFFVLFLAAGALVTPAQETAKQAVAAPAQDVLNIVNETYPLDAEYAVDILLRIARSESSGVKKWRKELLLEAFRRLHEIQQPTRRRLAISGIEVDNRQFRLSEAFEKNLDSLSLRTRIIRQMLAIDPVEARRMVFEPRFTPKPRPPDCEEALSDDYGSFYDAVAEVAKTTFTREEIKDQVRLIAVLPFIETIGSMSQIAPVGKMIISIGAEKNEINQLLLAYGSAIRGMRAGDREFSAFLWSYDWIREFMSVLKTCEGTGVQCSDLKDSLAAFLRKSFRAERCADSVGAYRQYAPSMVGYLNKTIFTGAPLKTEDLKTSSIGASAKLDPYDASPGARRIGERYRQLRWKAAGSSRPEYSSAEYGSAEYSSDEKFLPEWLERFEKLLEEVESWTGEDEKNRAAFFHQKCAFYHILYELAPAGNKQARVLRSFGNFVLNDPMKAESRIEWFYWVDNYMKMAGTNAGLAFELLDNSRSPVVRLYARLPKTAEIPEN